MMLTGCIRDAHNVASFLSCTMSYTSIHLLIDDNNESESMKSIHTYESPTTKNILHRLNDTVRRTHTEHVIALDSDVCGVITDDVIRILMSAVHTRTKVFMMFDCCHSGTLADLQYTWCPGTLGPVEMCVQQRFTQSIPVHAHMIVLGGCTDANSTFDANGEGVMTRAFLDCMYDCGGTITCFQLLVNMNVHILKQDIQQVPHMSSNRMLSRATIFSINSSELHHVDCI